MIHPITLAGLYDSDLTAIAGISMVLFGVLAAGIWKGALGLCRIAKALDKLSEENRQEKEKEKTRTSVPA